MNTQETNSLSLTAIVEKLDGGFVSNITGKKRIYKDAYELDDIVQLKSLFDKIAEGEYHLGVSLTSKEDFNNMMQESIKLQEELISLEGNVDDGLSILEKAKRDGIIKLADTFDPEPKVTKSNIIAINKINCYSIAELKAIDWLTFDKSHPLTIIEKAKIAGITDGAMYPIWAKINKGEAKFKSPQSRIGMTILAKYYEKVVGNNVVSIDKTEELKTNMLALIRELELSITKDYTKSTVVSSAVGKMRKILI